MKKMLVILVLVGAFFQGCTNNVAQPNTAVTFNTPSKFSSMKEGENIYIQNLYNSQYRSKNLITQIKSYFKKDKVYTVVNNIQNARYVLSINTFYSYRADSSKDAKHNKKSIVKTIVYRDRNGNETGGQDKIEEINYKASTGTLSVTVSIYDRVTLEPLLYFDITPTDTVKVKRNQSNQKSSVYTKKFTKEVVAKLNDLLSKKDKEVKVFLPNNGDSGLKKSLVNRDLKQLFIDAKKILPSFTLENMSTAKYDEIEKLASEENSKIVKRDIELDLSNYYLYYMAKESTDISVKNIREVFNAYKKILALTQNESLILAASNSLGRIEFKADRLNINLGAQ